MADYDLAVIGGGIHGAGIARDAAMRGIRVILIEQGDLASGTSSASTKLIHGGLRYLEHGDLRLVHQSLAEREVMLKIARHIVRPMRFVLPLEDGRRPAWMIRLGLLLYDWIGGRTSLPRSKQINLNMDPAGAPLSRRFTTAFEYSDCAVDDSRLVILNALDASERGATIRTHTRCIRAYRTGTWELVLNSRGRRSTVSANVLVNATGPWSAPFSETVLQAQRKAPVRLVKGSHILVPSLFDHGKAYIFQNADRRIVFAIPYQRDFTMIGTTDNDFTGDVATQSPSIEEITYLCNAANAYFRQAVSPGDVVHAFSGVRLLYDDGSHKAQDVGRDHHLELDRPDGSAPLLHVYGGKLTTYRKVAGEALDMLNKFFVTRRSSTGAIALPGGDNFQDGGKAFSETMHSVYPWLEELHLQRLISTYGTRTQRVLENATKLEDLGRRFCADLTEAEVRYLMKTEWAETADDVLWRRTKLGLRASSQEKEALDRYMASMTGVV